MGVTMPQQGRDWKTLQSEMEARGAHDVKWREGKTAVYVFNAGEDVARVQKEAYSMYISENGLGPVAFPSLKQMEEEVVSMGLGLLQGPEGACGNLTSGGTDSITMAIKACRDWARSAGRGTREANIVVPFSAHPAFDKACHMMDIDLRRIPVGADLLADVAAVGRAVDDETIMIVGSVPCFPYGLVDPIDQLGGLAEEKDVWLHVDACVGGYFAPFARMSGVSLPPFDFAVPGVRSISADLHKYGYCAKGASTVLFRSEELRQYMVFDCDKWPGGRMITPTLAGTRPGGAIAAAWAVMNYLGIEGYQTKQQLVMETRAKIEAGVKALGFRVLGEPKLGLLAYTRDDVKIFDVWGKLFEKGWFTAVVTQPKAIHLMLSPYHAEVADQYLADLEEALAAVQAGEKGIAREARYA
jgi:glutamate/tyrosine decarboxylase-like PLP-dependent enzyme